MIRFVKAHAYGNDFLYVAGEAVPAAARVALARAMCDRHSGVGADGLIFFVSGAGRAEMTLFNADGSRAEVSGNGVRGLAALLLQHDPAEAPSIDIGTEVGRKTRVRSARSGARHTFRASMGSPLGLKQVAVELPGETVQAVVLSMGNPQCVLLGPLPDEGRFRRVGAALERHPMFPDGTNVEFASVDRADVVRILIWERGVGPTTSSGTGSCAALVAAAAYGGALRAAEVVAPGGSQRVEWDADGVFLTGWAEIICEGEWLQQISHTAADE